MFFMSRCVITKFFALALVVPLHWLSYSLHEDSRVVFDKFMHPSQDNLCCCIFKGLRVTAGRRPTWVCVGLGRVHVKLSLVVVRVGDGGPILSKVKLSGAHLGPRLGQVGPCGLCWAHLEPMLSLCWAYVGLCLAYVRPMLA